MEEAYIVQPLALGLSLEDGPPTTPTISSPKPRRQSLSQRLGFQSTTARNSDTDDASQASDAGDADGSPQQSATAPQRQGSPVAAARQRTASQGARAKTARIECVEVCGTDVYVGTSNGQLVHYTVATAELEREPGQESQATSQEAKHKTWQAPERLCVQTVDLGLGGRRVEQLLAFSRLCRLVVLCGSTVVFYTLPSLRMVPGNTMPTIKGVSCIAYDERAQRSTATSALLCVARLREISVFRLTAELRLEHRVEIEHSVASLCMYGSFVCLADTQTYKVLDLADGGRELELLPTQQPYTDGAGRVVRPPRPRTLVVGRDEFMFLTASGDDEATLGVIVTALGEARRATLQFPAYPKALVYDEPYAVAVFASGRVDVYDTRASEPGVVQTLFGDACEPEPRRPRKVWVGAGTCVSSGIARPETIDAADAGVFDPPVLHGHVTRDPGVAMWTDAVPASVQWKRELLGAETGPDTNGVRGGLSRWVSASVVVQAHDSLYIAAPRPALARVDALIRSLRIEEAVQAVEASGPSSGPDELAYCYQMAGMECFKNMLIDDARQYFAKGALDPRALLHLFPEFTRFLGPLLVPFARIAMAVGLRQLFYEIGDARGLAEKAADQLSGSSDAQATEMRDTLCANTLELLERHLEHCRAQMLHSDDACEGGEPAFASDAVPLIDTALVRLYADNMRHDKLRALLDAPNSVVGDLACAYLLETQRYYYCSLVHRAQGEQAETLGIWRRILQGEYADAAFGGLREYLDYVACIEGEELLAAEYYWLVSFDMGASQQVLGLLSNGAVARLDADRVIKEMQRTGGDGVGSDAVLRAFIERLLRADHERATHYMTYLVTVYVRQLRELYAADTEAAHERRTSLETAYRCAQAEDMSLTFRAFLRAQLHTQCDDAVRLRARLMEILGARPPRYDARAVLQCVDSEAPRVLLFERAVLLVVLGRAYEAVELLVTRCGDYAEAELLLLRPAALASLAQLGPSRADDEALEGAAREPLGTSPRNVDRLLRMFLALGAADDDTAARLVASVLARYADHVRPGILDTLPAHWPYAVAAPFIEPKLAQLAHTERVGGVERSVGQAMVLGVQCAYADALGSCGAIVLDYAQTCAKCQKLLGSSAFVYAPETGHVKHISCT